MLEIIGHQRFGATPRVRVGIVEPLGRFFLQFVAQHIQIASHIEVQPRTDAHEKFLGVAQAIGRLVARRTAAIAPKLQDRPRGPNIAQRAGPFFHVGLELIQRVVELAMPVIGQHDQRLENLRMPLAARALQDRVEATGKLAITGERPQVRKRQEKFRIVCLEAIKIGQLTDMMAHRESQIP